MQLLQDFLTELAFPHPGSQNIRHSEFVIRHSFPMTTLRTFLHALLFVGALNSPFFIIALFLR